MREAKTTVVSKRSEIESRRGDTGAIGRVVEAAGVSRALDVPSGTGAADGPIA